MTPRYLADQLDRSLRNLGVECVDVFYLHNPETQLSEVSRDELKKRIREAFAFLESAVSGGKIGAYGLATWNAFREDSKAQGYFSLAEMEEIAREVGGSDHHFRFVQLPLNLAMPEALIRPNQVVQGKTMAMVQAARALGITLVSSAALLQGQLTRNLPPYIGDALGLKKNFEQRAAIRAIRAGRHDGAGGNEPRRARPRQSRARRRRARAPRSVPETLRAARLKQKARRSRRPISEISLRLCGNLGPLCR